MHSGKVFCKRAYFLFVLMFGTCMCAHYRMCVCVWYELVCVFVPGQKIPFTENTTNLNKTLDNTPCIPSLVGRAASVCVSVAIPAQRVNRTNILINPTLIIIWGRISHNYI